METPQPTTQPKHFTLAPFFQFLKRSWPDYLLLFLIAGTLVGLDQWTKALVRANVPLASDWLPTWLTWLAPYARIRYWYNSGAAFGFFQNGNTVFSILAVIVDCFIIFYFPRVDRKDWWLKLAMGMQFAGATGNLLDRLFFRHVTDFISVGNFAIFNVADASISVGVAVLIVGIWLKDRQEKKAATAAEPATATPENPPEPPSKG
jgi:signal peptidase II